MIYFCVFFVFFCGGGGNWSPPFAHAGQKRTRVYRWEKMLKVHYFIVILVIFKLSDLKTRKKQKKKATSAFSLFSFFCWGGGGEGFLSTNVLIDSYGVCFRYNFIFCLKKHRNTLAVSLALSARGSILDVRI